MHRRRVLLAALAAALVIGVLARVWWIARNDPFASAETCQRLLLGKTQPEAEAIIGRPADRYYTREALERQMSVQTLKRIGCPTGCADWLRAPVGIRLEFDAAGRAQQVRYTVLPGEERFIDRLRGWLRL